MKNDNEKLKIGFIIVLYKTLKSDVERLRREVHDLRFKNYEIYFIDNTKNNIGYAAGVNIGIKKAIKDRCDLFVVANPDISLTSLTAQNFLPASQHFDIWGLAMKQQGKIYYGGEVDKWRMSGGLIEKKPKKRFVSCDFVSGSLMFIKREVIEKIGLFEEKYFMYYEEVDYCWRAKKQGFKIGVASQITYDHFEVSKNNPQKEFYLFKNRLRFLLKYGSWKQKAHEFLRLPKTFYEEVIKRPFYLNFFSLNISSLVNKVLHFILFLLLIRNFRPEDYAVYTLAWTHLGLFLPLLDFGTTSYGLVNLSRVEKPQFSELFSFRFLLSIMAFITTIIFAFIFHYSQTVRLAILLVSIVVFSNMISGSFLIYASVLSKAYLVSFVSMIFQIILILSLIATIFVSRKIISLFFVTFVLYNLYSLANFILIKSQLKKISFSFRFSSLMKIAKGSMIFLFISLLAGWYSKIDVILLNFLRGQKEVGIYSAGYRFLDALMFMVTAYNVSSIPIYSQLAADKDKKSFINKIKHDFWLLFIIGGGCALGIFIFAPLILPHLFKFNYFDSIKVLRIIIFALPLILFTSIAINGLYALKKSKFIIYLFIFQLVFNVTLNYFLIPKFSYFASSWITIGGEILNTLLLFAILKTVLNKDSL